MEYWRRLREYFGSERFIITAAAGGIVREGRVLLVKNNVFDTWQTPGGIQEMGESLRETAEREIREELGLDLRAGPLVSVYSNPEWNIDYPDGGRIQQVLHFFRMEGELGEIHLQESELLAYDFFDMQNLPEAMMPSCRQQVRDLLEFNGTTIEH